MLQGLPNIGNSCFFNAAIQICRFPLTNIIIDENATEFKDNEYKLICDFYKALMDGNMSREYRIVYGMTMEKYRHGLMTQQDSREVVQLFTDKFKDFSSHKDFISIKWKKVITCDACGAYYITEVKNEIDSIIMPSIPNPDRVLESLHTVQAKLVEKDIILLQRKILPFKVFLATILSRDPIDKSDDLKCRDTCIKKNIKYQMVLNEVPRYLFIAPKRFDNALRKISTQMEIAESFNITTPVDLKKKIDQKDDSNYRHRYILYGIVIHYGKSLHGGHYVANIRMNDGWYLCNDNSVSKINEFSLESPEIQCNCTVLLYVKV